MTQTKNRFWSKVKKEENHWWWTGAVSNHYGSFRYEGKAIGAHIFSYYLKTGTFPSKNVLHHCDNTLCVRWDCLYEGTQAQNMKDKVLRGRQSRGTSIYGSVIDEGTVKDIRALKQAGLKNTEIAFVVNAPISIISQVVTGKSWSHVRS